MPAGIEAGVEITLDPVWKVETAPKPFFGEAKGYARGWWRALIVDHPGVS